jgi:hypothetical protein
LDAGAGRLPNEGWWVAAELGAAVGTVAAATWAQLRRDVRVASAAAALLAGGLAVMALHERARRQVWLWNPVAGTASDLIQDTPLRFHGWCVY